MQVVLCRRSCPSCSWRGLCRFSGCMFAGQSSSGFPAGRLQIPACLQLAWSKLMDLESPKASEKLKLKWNSCQGSYSAVVTMRGCVQERCVSSLQIWWRDWASISMTNRFLACICFLWCQSGNPGRVHCLEDDTEATAKHQAASAELVELGVVPVNRGCADLIHVEDI